jgi:glycosyltransferase involved in cell wall biosynthesis
MPSADGRMRVLLDGRKLKDGGIGVYTENLITGLLEVGGVDLTVLYRDESCRDAAYAKDVAWIREDARSYSVDELLFLSGRIDFSRFDIFHTPHYMVPYRVPVPTVVTIHDLIHITHPERFYYPWIARALIRSAVSRADSVLAVSRHTRQGVLELTGVSESKVLHVPNAISERLRVAESGSFVHGDSHPYLFALFSNVKPHKGLQDLLVAYREFREGRRWEEFSPRCPKLFLAGYGIETLLNTSEGNAMLEGVEGVRLAGALSDSDLRAALRGALALVVPSLVEGFCLPAIEAQSVGTPVVCRPVPALKEIVAEQDVVAESFSVESFAAALEHGVLAGLSSHREVPQAHLDLYSCRTIAARVKAAYEQVLASRRNV